MKGSLMLMTGLLAAGIGLSSIPNVAQASCQSICVVVWRNCMQQAGGDPGLEAACDAELDQCMSDCSGDGGFLQSQVLGKDESVDLVKVSLAK